MYNVKSAAYNANYNKGGGHIYRILLLYLTVAAGWDLRTGKIPNELIAAGLISGYIYHVYLEGVQGIVIASMYLVLPGILFYLLFRMHALGAGDIKLFSVVAVMSSFEVLCVSVVCSFVVGAAYALFALIYHRQLWNSLMYFYQYLNDFLITGEISPYQGALTRRDGTIHFAVAILVGYILTMGVVLLSN